MPRTGPPPPQAGAQPYVVYPANYPLRTGTVREDLMAVVRPVLRVWPAPGRRLPWVLPAALGIGVVAGLGVGTAPRPGIAIPVCAFAGVVAVLLAARTRERAIGRVAPALGGVALALSAVAAVRASGWLVFTCLLAALLLAAIVVLDARRWNALAWAGPLWAFAAVRAVPWAAEPWAAKDTGIRAVRPSVPWVTGAGIGVTSTVVVASLLASADPAYADLLGRLLPAADLTGVPKALFWFLATTAAVLGGCFAMTTRLAWPKAATRTPRHPAEWLTPIVLVSLTIASFLANEVHRAGQLTELLRRTGITYSGMAREGFWQLTVVTLLVMALLAWAGRAAAGGRRKLLGISGGVLLVLALLLGASALRRLAVYMDVYGWTVTRVNAWAFESWLGVVLVLLGLAWVLRRTDLAPRLVAGSAGVGLLVLALAGPDALVAAGSVQRYQDGKGLDVGYLTTLSNDAAPALNRLEPQVRACLVAPLTREDDPWTGWNLARSRTADQVNTAPAPTCVPPSLP